MRFWLSRRRLRTPLGLAGLLVVALLVAACGLASQNALGPSNVVRGLVVPSSAPTATPAVPAAIPRPAVVAGAPAAQARSADAASGVPQSAPAADQAQSQTSSEASTSPLAALDRMVIRTAKLVLQVADVDQAVDRVRQAAQAGGGYLSASNTRIEQDRPVADLTLQVRSDALDATLQALRGLGKVDSETSTSQDVTEEYVDLDANMRNLQASESAILRLMDRAQRIEDIISLQRELTNVRGQIERIQGRKSYLERRTDMASVSVSLHLPPAEGATTPGGGFDPLAVARRGWNASLAVLRGALEAVIVVAAFSWWLVPFVAVGVYLFTRRRPRPADA
jgi:Domain of unknown function (DUF4349)